MTLILAVLAAVVFAFFDYVGFNTVGQKSLVVYRVIQTAFQAWLTFLLWQSDGFWASLSFLILWWTFACDMIYYEFCRYLHWFKSESTDAFQQDVMGDKVTWASWTPYGLLRTLIRKTPKTVPINGAILVVQASVGMFIVITVQIFLLW